MNAFVNLSQALYQYCLYSGSMLPVFMVGNLRHANIPQSELDKFREEWLTYHESLERKLEMDKIEVSITDKEVRKMRDLENPMVIDSLWNDKHPKVVGECAGCEEEIYSNEDYFYLPHRDIKLHQNHECIHEYIINISVSVEGED